MRISKLTMPDSFWVLVVSGLLITGCCHYPKGRVARPLVNRTQTPAITVVAYGDTRTGPWGTGDNAAQAIHGAIVDDIFGNDGTIDSVVFTGDAVMSNC